MFAKYDEQLPGIHRFRNKGHITPVRPYKIFILVDPRDNTVRYVSSTKNAESMKKDHCSPSKVRKKNWQDKLGVWENELLRAGLRATFIVIDSANFNDKAKITLCYRRYFSRRGYIYNTTETFKKFEHKKRNDIVHKCAELRKTAALAAANVFLETRNSFDEIK